MTERLLVQIVEDDEDIAELVRINLIQEGYAARRAVTGEQALEMIKKEPPQLILLDLMLPGIDGLEVCRRIKKTEKLREIPIIFLTAKGEEQDIVQGLELGADDYVTKPFSPKVLTARVKTILRRSRGQAETQVSQDILRVHDFVIHPGRHEVLLQGKELKLTFSEFEILKFLAQRPGWVFTRTQIVDAIRGENYAVTLRSIDVQIVGLRKKLGSYGELIETVRGVGYRFKE